MRIKFTTHIQGFRGTARGDDPNIDRLFNPLSPSVAAEYRSKKSAIQNMIADSGNAIPTVFGSNGKTLLNIGGWYATTTSLALAALTRLESCGLLRDDKTIELCEYKKSPDYAAILREARNAGCRMFRPPVAKLHVSIALAKYDEEDFVYGTYPKSILSNLEIVREPPLEVVPLHQVATNLTAYIKSLAKQIECTGKLGMAKTWIDEAKRTLLNTRSIVVESMTMTTEESSAWKTKLICAIDGVYDLLDSKSRENSRWEIRRWAENIPNRPEYSILLASGLSVFDERPEPADSEINVNHIRVDDELSIDDI